MFDLNLELHSGLKVRGCEINFIIKKLLKSKNPRGFYYTNIKSFSNKSASTFWPEQLLYIKVDFGASDFEAALQLQIEAKQKLLGRSVAFGVKSVRKHLIGQNFFELMTPTPHGKRYMFRESNCKSNNVTSLKWSQITRNGSRWHVN